MRKGSNVFREKGRERRKELLYLKNPPATGKRNGDKEEQEENRNIKQKQRDLKKAECLKRSGEIYESIFIIFL